MVDSVGRLVLWLLVAEAGLIALGLFAYLALTFIRGRDVVSRVASLELDVDALTERIDKALKRLSPGRPRGDVEPPEREPLETRPAQEHFSARRPAPDGDRAARLAAIRSRMAGALNGR